MRKVTLARLEDHDIIATVAKIDKKETKKAAKAGSDREE